MTATLKARIFNTDKASARFLRSDFMADFQGVFKRSEIKYLVDEERFGAFMEEVLRHMKQDDYGRTTICSIYFDTPQWLLVRRSIEKPVYKEKLRLRTYGIPSEESGAFVELKKKYKGIVYKRRIKLPYRKALNWLCGGECPESMGQIGDEISWVLDSYEDLQPAAALFYDRVALYGIDDPLLRLTVDENVRFRCDDMDLIEGDAGVLLTKPGERLVEIKIAGAMPLWLAELLSRLEIFPKSYSKYGNAFLNIQKNIFEGEKINV